MISGTVFDDVDRDSVQTTGDIELSGITVNLLDENGDVIATTTTDTNGDYEFTNLTP